MSFIKTKSLWKEYSVSGLASILTVAHSWKETVKSHSRNGKKAATIFTKCKQNQVKVKSGFYINAVKIPKK